MVAFVSYPASPNVGTNVLVDSLISTVGAVNWLVSELELHLDDIDWLPAEAAAAFEELAEAADLSAAVPRIKAVAGLEVPRKRRSRKEPDDNTRNRGPRLH